MSAQEVLESALFPQSLHTANEPELLCRPETLAPGHAHLRWWPEYSHKRNGELAILGGRKCLQIDISSKHRIEDDSYLAASLHVRDLVFTDRYKKFCPKVAIHHDVAALEHRVSQKS